MKIIDHTILEELSTKAKRSERKRMNFDLHYGPHDVLQRLLNAMEPGTYVRPHKHDTPDKREVFIMLRGRMAVVIFDGNGRIENHAVLDNTEGKYLVEIPPKKWHTLICLQQNTVMYEIKDGPYDVATDKQFANWAPQENTAEAQEYLAEIIKLLKLGDF